MTRGELVAEVGTVVGLGLLIAILALTGPCDAKADPEPGATYSWRTVDGTYSFTDDPDQIPAVYREVSVKAPRGKLAGYPRYTPLGGADAVDSDPEPAPAG